MKEIFTFATGKLLVFRVGSGGVDLVATGTTGICITLLYVIIDSLYLSHVLVGMFSGKRLQKISN